MRRDGSSLAPLPKLLLSSFLLLLLALQLVTAHETEASEKAAKSPGWFKRIWNFLFGSKTTTSTPTASPTVKPASVKTTAAAPTASPTNGPIAVNTTATAQPVSEATAPSSEEADDPIESQVEAGKATDGQGDNAVIIPWWVGLLIGLTLAGWMIMCTLWVMCRRGYIFKIDRSQESLEMSKFPSPLDFHHLYEPPPSYQNPSYCPSPDSPVSPDMHVYEEPQFPSCDNQTSKLPPISKRPPAVPFRPEEFANDYILSESGATDKNTFSEKNVSHRNSLYNGVPSLSGDTSINGVCPIRSVETVSDQGVSISNCESPVEKKECSDESGTDREIQEGTQPAKGGFQWKFIFSDADTSEAHLETSSVPDAGDLHRNSLYSGEFHQYDFPPMPHQSSQGNTVVCVEEEAGGPTASAASAATLAAVSTNPLPNAP